jgi:DNA-binding transcriptional ArsR family regulator
MSLSIQSNVNNIKTSVFFSKTVEIIAVASMLSDIKHHEYARSVYEEVIPLLNKDSIKTLELISYLPFQGLEIIELVLDSRCYDSVDLLCEKILNYSNEYFIYYLVGETINIERIKALRLTRKKFDDFLCGLPWVIRGNTFVFEHILYDTDTFKSSLAGLLKDIDNEYINSMQDSQKLNYQSSVEQMLVKLQSENVVAVASSALNKKIEDSPEIREYIFVPSFFISPHYLLAFNKFARMIIFDIREDERQKRIKEGEDLTEKLKVISDKTRLELLRLLILQPTYGKLLSNRLNLTTATISHHLEQLKSNNLVKENKTKNTKFFSANTEEIDKLLNGLKDYLYNK